MRKVLACIGTLAFGITLAAGSALAQSETYPMGISSPAFGPGVSSATPPAATTTSRPSRSATRRRQSHATAKSSFAHAPSSSPAVVPGAPGGGH
jgi:hypothetical protein